MSKVTLVCKAVSFYSGTDEDMFFAWIKKIPSITKFDGAGDELYLHINNNAISDDDLRELIALFYRYKIDMTQLRIFLNDSNKEWFEGKPRGYWYKKVFASK